MRSFIVLLCLVPTLLLAQQSKLETQLKQAIKDKKAEIGIAVIINGKDTVTVNNDTRYPLMSVFKFHQALALADYMGKKTITGHPVANQKIRFKAGYLQSAAR